MDSGYAEMMHEVDVLEYRLNQHYRQAEKELQEKINKYYKDFDRLDQKKREQVAKGEITDAEYKTWRQNKILSGKVWEQRKDVISRDLYNTNYMARNMVYDELPDVYASAHNFATYQVESGAHVDTSYVLYNRESVERLIADNPDLLPYQKINYALDTSWNKKNLQSVMIQGILQGESIPHLAKRLSKTVTQRNRAAAIRNARTMATSAYNGGKMDAFKRAKALGIDMKVRWRATFDNRTRDSHRALDGETVEVGQPFSNGLTFPCDMSFLNNLKNGSEKVINFSKGCRETYNCRCTIQGVSGRLEPRAIKYRSNAAVGISYEDWKKGHKYADDVRAGKIKPYEPPKHKNEKKPTEINKIIKRGQIETGYKGKIPDEELEKYNKIALKQIMKDTGYSEEQAEKFQKAYMAYFGGKYEEIETNPNSEITRAMIDGFSKMPIYDGKVSRGVIFQGSIKQFTDLKKGDKIPNKGIIESWTSDKAVSDAFGGIASNGNTIIFECEDNSVNGVGSQHLSKFGTRESEVIVTNPNYECTDITTESKYKYLKEHYNELTGDNKFFADCYFEDELEDNGDVVCIIKVKGKNS